MIVKVETDFLKNVLSEIVNTTFNFRQLNECKFWQIDFFILTLKHTSTEKAFWISVTYVVVLEPEIGYWTNAVHGHQTKFGPHCQTQSVIVEIIATTLSALCN